VSVIVIPPDSAGIRLDKALASAGLDLSRTRLKALILGGAGAVNGTVALDPNTAVQAGDTVEIEVPDAAGADPAPQDIPLNILFEDQDVIIIDKPPGMVVHPAAGAPDGTLVNALLYHCGLSLTGIGGVLRPGIVHRLDKDTSGVMVAAKTQPAHDSLVGQFANRSVTRRYLALVAGVPSERAFTVDAAIGRSRHNRKKMAVLENAGRPAVTHIQRDTVFGTWASEVECRLETGRTHQIRVHLAHAGHPVIGDPLYGNADRHLKKAPEAARETAKAFKRQALHAGTLGFVHPRSGKPLLFNRPPPADYAALKQALSES